MTTQEQRTPTGVALECPVCGRALPPAPFMRWATEIVKRSCRKCAKRWVVKVAPLGQMAPGAYLHEATWTEVAAKIAVARAEGDLR